MVKVCCYLIVIKKPKYCVGIEIDLSFCDTQILHNSRFNNFLKFFNGQSKSFRYVIERFP